MNMNCDRCQGPTRPKQIYSKKNHQTYNVLECAGSCRNGKYSYTFFPPREEMPVIQTEEPKQSNGKAVTLLEAILHELKTLNKALLTQQGQIHISKEELEPDEEVPF